MATPDSILRADIERVLAENCVGEPGPCDCLTELVNDLVRVAKRDAPEA